MNAYEKCDKLFYGHTGWTYSVCCDSLGNPYSGSNDNTIRSWDLEYVQCEQVMMGHGARVTTLASADSSVISGSWDSSVRVWDTRSGKETQKMKSHFSEVNEITCSGNRVYSVSSDQHVVIWDLTTGSEVRKIHAGIGNLSSCCFSEKNKRVYVAAGSGSLKSFDTMKEDGDPKLYTGMYNDITSVCTSDSLLFCGTVTGEICAWDLQSGEQQYSIKEHTGSVTCMKVHNLDNKPSLFTGSSDGSIRVWDLDTKECKRVYERIGMRVLCLALSKDHMYNGCDEEVLRSWKL